MPDHSDSDFTVDTDRLVHEIPDEPETSQEDSAARTLAERAFQDVESDFLNELRCWLTERIHNSPVSQNTAAYNHLVQELPGLAVRLAALFQED